MRYDMNLYDGPFDCFKNREKDIELRLNDEKRQKIRSGDRIFFHRLNDRHDILKCEVSDVRCYSDFRQLYAKEDLFRCGYKVGDTPSFEDMYAYYSKEAIERCGVLAIEVKVSDEPYWMDGHVHLEHGPLTKEYVLEFVREAERKGLDELDILDHSHRFREFRSCYDHLRIYPQQDEWLNRPSKFADSLEDYDSLIREIRKLDLPLRVCFGLEVCYTEDTEELLREILKDGKYDFLTGSVHSVGHILYDMPFSEELLKEKYTEEEVCHLYYERLINCASSGLFARIGHPDQIKVTVSDSGIDLTEDFRKLARVLSEKQVIAENNTGCHWRYGIEEIGNSEKLLEIFKEHNVRMIAASDAHDPQNTGLFVKEATQRIRQSEIEGEEEDDAGKFCE